MSARARDAAGQASVNTQAKRKQYLYLSLIGGLLAAGVIVLTSFGQGDGVPGLRSAPRLTVPGDGVSTSVLWRQSAEQDIRVLEESEKRLRKALSNMEEKLGVVEEEINRARVAEQEAAFEREVLRIASMDPPGADPLVTTPLPPRLPVDPPFSPPPSITLLRVGGGGQQGPLPGSAVDDISPQATPAETLPADDGERQSEGYVPGGSFMQAIVLGGIDAPTSNVSRDNPHPVLLRVRDAARLPSLARRNLKGCLVLAAGYGDISSERALLRTERMSCQREDGTFYDEPVRGFVVGEDGRAGLRGKLVTKQGQILQRSLLAGIGSGLGEVFRTSYAENLRASTQALANSQAATVNIDSPTPDFGRYAAAGLSSGAGTALGRLADYYIALADRIHPIVEVGAGRTVDIVLQEGIDLSASVKARR